MEKLKHCAWKICTPHQPIHQQGGGGVVELCGGVVVALQQFYPVQSHPDVWFISSKIINWQDMFVKRIWKILFLIKCFCRWSLIWCLCSQGSKTLRKQSCLCKKRTWWSRLFAAVNVTFWLTTQSKMGHISTSDVQAATRRSLWERELFYMKRCVFLKIFLIG